MGIIEIPIKIFQMLGQDPQDLEVEPEYSLKRLRKAKGPMGTVLFLSESVVWHPKTDANLLLFDREQSWKAYENTGLSFLIEVCANPITSDVTIRTADMVRFDQHIWGGVCHPYLTIIGVIIALVGQLTKAQCDNLDVLDWWSEIIGES